MISGLIVLVSLVGAGVLRLLRDQAARVHWGASVVMAALILVLIFGLAPQLPAEFVLSSWRPPALFQAQLHLTFDRSSWSLLVAAAVLLLSLYLASASRPGIDNPATRALAMLYFGMAAAAFMAANAVTVALSWALVDVISFLFLLGPAEDYKTVEGLTRHFGLQAVSVLLIVASALPFSVLRGDVEAAVRPLMMVMAVFFRIGLFPLHAGLPVVPGPRFGLASMVRLLPPAMGLAVLSRQLPSTPSTSLQVILLSLGGLSVAIGGFRWATAAPRAAGRPFLVLIFGGLAAAVGSIGSGARLVVVALGVSMILVGAALYELVIHQRWHRGIGYLAALVAVGAPLTAGHLSLRLLEERTSLPIFVPLFGILLVGLLLLPAGALRLAQRARVAWESGEPLVRGAYGLGLALPVAASVPIGLMLRAQPTVPSALLSFVILVLGLAAGYAIDRWSLGAFSTVVARVSAVGELAPGVLGGLWSGSLHRSARFMRGLGHVLEGRAAMLWIYVIVLFVSLVAMGAGG